MRRWLMVLALTAGCGEGPTAPPLEEVPVAVIAVIAESLEFTCYPRGCVVRGELLNEGPGCGTLVRGRAVARDADGNVIPEAAGTGSDDEVAWVASGYFFTLHPGYAVQFLADGWEAEVTGPDVTFDWGASWQDIDCSEGEPGGHLPE